MALALFINQVFVGLTIGLILTLAALGLSIIIGHLGIVNFAHGTFYAFGGYFAYTFYNYWGSPMLSLAGAALITALIGLVVVYGISEPLRERHPLEPMVALAGFGYIGREVIRKIWGPTPKNLGYSSLSFPIKFNIFGITVHYSGYYLIVIIISTLLLFGCYYLFYKTDLGIRSLASIQDREMTTSLGVNATKITILMILLGIGLAGIGGALAGPIFTITPTMGLEISALLFAIVIMGGLGSIKGTVTAGLIVGLGRTIPTVWIPALYARMLVFIVFIIMLAIRPRGLMGMKEVLE